MKYTNIKEIAEKNLKTHISENAYPGRGIVLGKNLENSWILIYWIMGRSLQSRNRIFKHENGILRTESINNHLLKNTNFTIYNVMRDVEKKIVVTNGSHTDTICKRLKNGGSFFTSLKSEKHESDHPNYTSRIAGLIEQSESSISFAKISKSDFSFYNSSYHYFKYSITQAGYGYCLTTYMGDGDPPPKFEGDPILLPIKGSAKEIASKYWNELNSENRVSLFVREVIKSGEDNLQIINSFG